MSGTLQRRPAAKAALPGTPAPAGNRDLGAERVFLLSMSPITRDPSERAREGMAARGLRLPGRWLRARGAPQLGSCPVCHGRVQPDDALGLVGRNVAHAECALVSWLGPGLLSRELL